MRATAGSTRSSRAAPALSAKAAIPRTSFISRATNWLAEPIQTHAVSQPQSESPQSDYSWACPHRCIRAPGAAYYNFDQYLYQPEENVDRGIGLFGRVGFSDGVANPVHEFYSGGVGGKGMIPTRKNDQFGIGYYYVHAANARIPQVLGFRDSEGFEAYYEIALTPWMHLTPDVQVLSPSQQRVDTATVLGVRSELKF